MFQVQMKAVQSDWIPLGKPCEHAGDAAERVKWFQSHDAKKKEFFEYRITEVLDER